VASILGRDDDGDGIEDDLIASRIFIGEPLGSIYDYVEDGIYQIGDPDIPDGYSAGAQRMVDQNGDGDITPESDRVIKAYEEPAYRISLNNEFKYKNFTLRVFLNSIQGGKNRYYGLNDPWQSNPWPGTGNIVKEFDYWLPEHTDAEYKALRGNSLRAPKIYKQRSFVRLQNVSLAYNFTLTQLQSLGIDNLKVYVNGTNLYTWTKWKGWDPETGIGLESTPRPVLQNYTFGVDITF